MSKEIIMNEFNLIPPQTGAAFTLKKGDFLTVVDPLGSQVSDMVLFNLDDKKEKLSSGKTLDFEESILISAGNFLWSNRSHKMMERAKIPKAEPIKPSA